MTRPNPFKLSPVQRREIDAAVDGEVICAPSTYEALRAKGRVGPALRRFTVEARFGNRNFVVCALRHGPW